MKFLETYSYAEFTSELDPGDPFFKMINTDEAVQTSSKLGFCPESKAEEVWSYIHSPAFQKMLPDDLAFAWGANQLNKARYLYALKEFDTEYNGPVQSDIKEIRISDDLLLITFSKDGSEKWTTFTRKSLGSAIAIVIDNQVYSAPMVREVIKDGKCAISGNFSEDDLVELKAALEK